MRIFLAGASGVIGRRIIAVLIAQGHQVTGLTRKNPDALRAHGAVPVMGDVYDVQGLHQAVRAAAPEVVMHQLTDLAVGDREANARIRTEGTRNLVDAAQAAGARRVIAQSIAWAYEGGDEPADEQTPLDVGGDAARKGTVDGVTALENTVQTAPEWVILRYGLLYGPSTWYAQDGLMADKARSAQLVADADVSSFVHVDDAAAAAVQALDWPTGTVNICDDEPAAGRDWVPAFCRAVGAPEPPQSDARTAWARGADNHYARKHLGWTPRYPSWREGFSSL